MYRAQCCNYLHFHRMWLLITCLWGLEDAEAGRWAVTSKAMGVDTGVLCYRLRLSDIVGPRLALKLFST